MDGAAGSGAAHSKKQQYYLLLTTYLFVYAQYLIPRISTSTYQLVVPSLQLGSVLQQQYCSTYCQLVPNEFVFFRREHFKAYNPPARFSPSKIVSKLDKPPEHHFLASFYTVSCAFPRPKPSADGLKLHTHAIVAIVIAIAGRPGSVVASACSFDIVFFSVQLSGTIDSTEIAQHSSI